MITIKKENFFSELGGLQMNEDSFAYIPGGTYIVCDGIGGPDKGDIASKIVVKSFIESFRNEPNSSVDDVLKIAENQITEHISSAPQTEGMGSTLSFAQIRRDGIYIAWIGNSRIYQFRNGELIYMTTDHSWVGEAVKTGLISEEETADHPKSGLITRVIQGSHKSTRVESGLLTDVQRGDVFLMCTGSVSQVWSNEDFVNLFKETTDLDELRAQIISKCALRSRDNFTGIILQVHDARIPANDNPPQAAETIIEPIAPNNPPLTEPTVEKVVEPLIEKVEEPVVTNAPTVENSENSKNFKKYAGFGVIGLLILIIIWKWPSSGASEDSNKESADTTVKANVIMPLDSIKIKDTVKVDTAGKKAKTPEKSNQKTDVKKDTVVKTNPKVQKKPVKQNYRWKRPKKKKKKVYRRNRNSGRQQ